MAQTVGTGANTRSSGSVTSLKPKGPTSTARDFRQPTGVSQSGIPGILKIPGGQVAPTSRPAPAAPSPLPNAGISSGGASGGGGIGVTSTGQAANIAPQETTPTPPPFDPNDPIAAAAYFQANDPTYVAESGGYKNTLDAALANLALRRSQYDQDFITTLKNLGWDWQGDVNGQVPTEADPGQWDASNLLGAYGSGLQNLTNDFAGRGLLDSTFFGSANQRFNTDFNNQRTNLINQRSNSIRGFDDESAAANAEYKNALTRALLGATTRFNATNSL